MSAVDTEAPFVVLVKYRDGTDEEFTTTKMPWNWRTFTVIDRGHHVLAYIPNDIIGSFEVLGGGL